MSKDTLKLNDREVLEYARGTLEPHLALEADGYTCTTADLFNVLLGVAAGRGTLESGCGDFVCAPPPGRGRSTPTPGRIRPSRRKPKACGCADAPAMARPASTESPRRMSC